MATEPLLLQSDISQSRSLILPCFVAGGGEIKQVINTCQYNLSQIGPRVTYGNSEILVKEDNYIWKVVFVVKQINMNSTYTSLFRLFDVIPFKNIHIII